MTVVYVPGNVPLLVRPVHVISPRPDGELKVVSNGLVPGATAQLRMHGLAALAVPEHYGWPGRSQPAVAPLHERDQDGEQLGALAGEAVGHPGTLPRLTVGLAFQQALVNKFPEPGSGDRLADADALGEVVESR